MPHIVLLRGVHQDAIARIEAEPGYTWESVNPDDRGALEKAMAKGDAIIVRATPINEDFLSISPSRRSSASWPAMAWAMTRWTCRN